MLAKIKYTEDDFKKFAKFSIGKNLKVINISSIVVVFSIVIQLVSFFMGNKIDWWLIVGITALMVFSYLVIGYSYKMPLKINTKRYVGDGISAEIEFLEDKLVSKLLNSNEVQSLDTIAFSGVFKAVETPHAFYIYINKLAALLIPKRELSEELVLHIQTILAKNVVNYKRAK